MTGKHTSGTWYVFDGGPRPYGEVEISTTVGDMSVTVGFASKKDAARIVSCRNACEGIADPSVVLELMAIAQEFLDFAKSGKGFTYPLGSLQRLEQAMLRVDGKP